MICSQAVNRDIDQKVRIRVETNVVLVEGAICHHLLLHLIFVPCNSVHLNLQFFYGFYMNTGG